MKSSDRIERLNAAKSLSEQRFHRLFRFTTEKSLGAISLFLPYFIARSAAAGLAG
jgi:hypothetical protein